MPDGPCWRPVREKAPLGIIEDNPHIDVLFTDIQLAGQLSGWDVAEAFRAVKPEMPVIYASGNTSDWSRAVDNSQVFGKPYRTQAERPVDPFDRGELQSSEQPVVIPALVARLSGWSSIASQPPLFPLPLGRGCEATTYSRWRCHQAVFVSRRCGRKSFGRTGRRPPHPALRATFSPRGEGTRRAHKMDRGHPRNDRGQARPGMTGVDRGTTEQKSRPKPGLFRQKRVAQLTWVQVPSGLRQAVPRMACGRPSIQTLCTKLRQRELPR